MTAIAADLAEAVLEADVEEELELAVELPVAYGLEESDPEVADDGEAEVLPVVPLETADPGRLAAAFAARPL